MLEKEVQKRCVRLARSRGIWARKFQAAGRRSAPDYIFAYCGDIFFVEFKRTGEQPTELQQIEHEEMRAHGMTVYVCDDPWKFEGILIHEMETARGHRSA